MGAVARLFVFGACLTVATSLVGIRSATRLDYWEGRRPGRPAATGRHRDGDQAATGFTRTTVTAETGAYSVPNLEPGTYTRHASRCRGSPSSSAPTSCSPPGSTSRSIIKMQVAGVSEEVIVTGESPLVEKTSNQIGGSLSRTRDRGRALELPQLHGAHAADSGHHAEPGRLHVRRRPGRGQRHAVAAERLPARRDVQQRRSPRRQPGHAGARRARQHRGVPGAVEPVQRRVRRRRRRDHQHGDARRHQQLQRPRLHLLPRRHASTRATPSCPTMHKSRRSGRCRAASGWAARSSATAPTSTSRSRTTSEQIAGFKRFPAAAAPLATDMLGEFERRRQQLLRPWRPADQREQLRQRALAARNRADQGRGLQHQQRRRSTRRPGRATGIT